MFLLVAGIAQSRGRTDEPIRTQHERSRSRDRESRRSKRRSAKESDSSNNYPPIIVGPLTTNQDLTNIKGEKIYNLPLMIQQPFLREKKEPIKVDISVKLVPKPRKKEKKKRGVHVEEIVVQADENRGVKNSISMEVSDGDVHVLNETVEIIEDVASAEQVTVEDGQNENPKTEAENLEVLESMSTENIQQSEEITQPNDEANEQPDGNVIDVIQETVETEGEVVKESETTVLELQETAHEEEAS